MYELNDPVLLEQCIRIKTMIEKVAQNPEYRENYYAKLYHHWELSPPVQPWEIEEFENKSGVQLPIEYVYYLTQVGRGGAAPGTFFRDFDANEKYEEHDVPENGTICLCAMDLTFVAYLIVTGPMRGRVVYLDYDGDDPPMWPKGSPDFLTWCENFYSELLAGYDIRPIWKFMWQEPGDDSALICAFQNAEDIEYQKEVLYSFCKFKKLSKKAQQFLESIQEPELHEEAAKVLKNFNL